MSAVLSTDGAARCSQETQHESMEETLGCKEINIPADNTGVQSE